MKLHQHQWVEIQQMLQTVLLDLFSPVEFHQFLTYYNSKNLVVGQEFVKELPPYSSVSPKEYFFVVSEGLIRRGIFDDFFIDSLCDIRPGRRDELKELFGILFSSDSLSVSKKLQFVKTNPENPYVPFAPFTGRQDVLHEIENSLSQGNSVVLIGGRRAGKTTLMNQINDMMVNRNVVRLDAAQWPLHLGEESVLTGIGSAIGSLPNRNSITAALVKLSPVCLLIDEADRLLGHRWTNDFLAWLRHLDDTFLRTDLAFLLVGGPKLIRHQSDDMGSPVLNTYRFIYLSPLTLKDRGHLLRFLPKDIELDRLYPETGGHPWLLTKTLGFLWEGLLLDDALEQVFIQSQSHIEAWKRQLGKDGVELMQHINQNEVSVSSFGYKGSLKHWAGTWMIVRSMCMVDIGEDKRISPSAGLVWDILKEGCE